jgi:hypothetical protein
MSTLTLLRGSNLRPLACQRTTLDRLAKSLQYRTRKKLYSCLVYVWKDRSTGPELNFFKHLNKKKKWGDYYSAYLALPGSSRLWEQSVLPRKHIIIGIRPSREMMVAPRLVTQWQRLELLKSPILAWQSRPQVAQTKLDAQQTGKLNERSPTATSRGQQQIRTGSKWAVIPVPNESEDGVSESGLY